MPQPSILALKARYVFPAVGPPIADGVVAIQGDKIVAVGKAPAGEDVRDLGNVAILPGLVNAHTHLEFSKLARPVGRGNGKDRGAGSQDRPISFTDWLRAVMASRSSGSADGHEAVEAGLQESLRLGVTTVGEIAQPGWSAAAFEQAGLGAIVFLELIGSTPDRVEAAIQVAESHLRQSQVDGCWQPGLSPHAPYSVSPELLNAAVRLAVERHVPIAMHLAESREELELIGHGTGPFREFLADVGAWRPEAIRRGTRPLDYLRTLAAADRALVVHGNYLDAEEIAFLAKHRDRMSVVYCPRTHAWFGHEPYPLPQMLDAGVMVALGTDSRASSPDLSVLAEMRHVAQAFPQIDGSSILRLGTIAAAKSLGREQEVGSLEPGKLANLAIIELDDRTADDPYSLILDSDRPVASTWLRGHLVFF